MKQTIITGLIILVIIGLLSVIVLGSKEKQTVSQSSTTALNVSPTVAASNIPVFFYGNTCPHCKDVEKWMTENRIEEKIKIVKKEVYDNRANSLELAKVAQSCGLPTDRIGVPVLYTEGKCLIGTPDITDYLSQKMATPESTTSTEGGQI